MNLKIKEIEIIPVKSNKGLIGYVSFLLNDSFKIENVVIYSCPSSTGGIRLVFPTRESNGYRFNTIYPINKQAYNFVTDKVSKAYMNLIDSF